MNVTWETTKYNREQEYISALQFAIAPASLQWHCHAKEGTSLPNPSRDLSEADLPLLLRNTNANPTGHRVWGNLCLQVSAVF